MPFLYPWQTRHPRHKPDKLHADKACDHRRCRPTCHRCQIKPRLARRGVIPVENSAGIGGVVVRRQRQRCQRCPTALPADVCRAVMSATLRSRVSPVVSMGSHAGALSSAVSLQTVAQDRYIVAGLYLNRQGTSQPCCKLGG